MEVQHEDSLPAGALDSHPWQHASLRAVPDVIYSPKLTRRLDLMATSSVFQLMFLFFCGKPCSSKVLQLCDGHLGKTWLQSLSCYRRDKKFSLPLCRPHHDSDDKLVSCSQCHFLPCVSLSGATFSACCCCGILSTCMLKFSSELPSLNGLAGSFSTAENFLWWKYGMCPCTCVVPMWH